MSLSNNSEPVDDTPYVELHDLDERIRKTMGSIHAHLHDSGHRDYTRVKELLLDYILPDAQSMLAIVQTRLRKESGDWSI